MVRSIHRRAVDSAIVTRVIEAVLLITIAACCCATGTAIAAEDLGEKPRTPAEAAVKRLVQAIKDKDIPATEAAFKTIHVLGVEQGAATAAEALLSSDDNDICCLAADTVVQFDVGQAVRLLPVFERGLKSKEPRIRATWCVGARANWTGGQTGASGTLTGNPG